MCKHVQACEGPSFDALTRRAHEDTLDRVAPTNTRTKDSIMRSRRFAEAPSTVARDDASSARPLAPPPMTERQKDFLLSLIDGRDIPQDKRDALRSRVLDGTVTKRLASTWIERLLSKPILHNVPRGLPDADAVPAGRYALRSEDGQDVSFYRVDRPEEGKWAGWVFVKHLVANGAHSIDALSETRVPQAQAAAILRRIDEVGAREASILFGRELGSCGVCGRVLTNQESREKGIGPVCEKSMGW